ncbi:MAG: hypothetical protein ONB05_06110 [candidate division KSB1 bacterium]|nr:hypothetical protein [candidate division KSB1 bacterium]
MYARKNSITLACFLIVFWLVGFWWYRRETKELTKLKSEEKQLKHQLEEANSMLRTQKALEREYRFLKQKWENANKILIASDEPAFSYQYLNRLITENQLAFDFDFILDKKTQHGSFSAFSYTLQGEGAFDNVYKLIWYLTATPILYQIKSIYLTNVDPNGDRIKFSIQLQSYSMSKDWGLIDGKEVTPVFAQAIDLDYNSFKPLIYQPREIATSVSRPVERPLPKVRDENLLDIRKVTLEAAMADKILVKDHTGKMMTLSLGDKVKGGYLNRIDLNRSEAEFLMESSEGQNVLILGLGYLRDGGKVSSNVNGGIFLN